MGATVGLLVATFVAAFVEFVEALTIVLAMGLTRGWRSALAGTAVAVIALAAFTTALGFALATWLPRTALQLVVGVLLLIFGLQWLRKAILRSSGRKALHAEDAAFDSLTRMSESTEPRRKRWGIDPLGFTVSLKGVFLEGTEVVFIVITFGLNANNVPIAVIGAAAAGIVVLALGIALTKPLSRVPENTLKYGVGLLLTSFGTFWSVSGLAAVTGGHVLNWPGDDWSILGLIVVWFGLTQLLITVLRKQPAEVEA
jgi:uncharacterized membrane protein